MADKIILKRSSILGKRPTGQVIQPGELALNTNSEDPGAFFEVSDGNIVKIGPTTVSNSAPTNSPERGESWFDTESGTLKIGSVSEAKKIWKSISSPFLGGSETCVFVAPEFSFSTDGLSNDGQSLPYKTLTRAILELSKTYIRNVLAGFPASSEANKFTIFLAPSLTPANNEAGSSLSDFNVDFSSDPAKQVTLSELTQFNSPSGGIIVPSGISLVGMDLMKSVLTPTYIPLYRNPALTGESEGINEPLTSILKCSGNTYLTLFSVRDKVSKIEVVRVTNEDSLAVFHSRRPHGFRLNDKVEISINPRVDQTSGTLTSGTYFAIPISPQTFYLSAGSQNDENPDPFISFEQVPNTSGLSGSLISISLVLRSAHRLSFVGNASLPELGDYYTKVQRAFSSFFGGRVTDGREIVNTGDYVIVGPTDAEYPDNQSSNTTKNASFYADQVNLYSEYGMCWGDFNGSVVKGFKSAVVRNSEIISLQNDPDVYEIYTTLVDDSGVSQQKWWNLSLAKYLSIPTSDRPEKISDLTVESKLSLLNSTPLNSVRYYYENLSEPATGKNLGVTDIDNDFRHFGIRSRNGSLLELESTRTIGPAIGVWSLNGGSVNLSNSKSNLGSVAFKAEGFSGINSIGGAGTSNKGFVLEGIQRPLALTKSQAENSQNKEILSLGSKILNIYIDPLDPGTQILELSSDFSPSFLLPYSLSPGSALWVETEDCTYRGFFATDGGPTVVTGLDDPTRFAKLRLRASDSTIPSDSQLLPVLGIPFIRRFRDPRAAFDRAYSLLISNTSPTSTAPKVGYVLRLNQTSQQLGSSSIRPNVQLDPGILGGWGRVFTVDAVETGSLGSSPQYNEVLADTNQDINYYIAITATDFSRPWGQGDEFKCPVGTYVTHKNRNWYSAENNLWDSVYYGNETSFNSEFGPSSIAPFQPYSPFVDSSVLERQDPVSEAFQGTYGPDALFSDDKYSDNDVYFRGATSPYGTYSTVDYYDGDDSSESLGICLTDTPDGPETFTVSDSLVIQQEQEAKKASQVGGPKRYRPAIIEFSVLSSVNIPNPKQKVSVLQISSEEYTEYIRVINLNGAVVRGVRLNYKNSSYTSYVPSSSYVWPKLSKVTVCSTNPIPESAVYDPDWLSTKRAVLRFFEVMGYSNEIMSQYLQPRYWGERLLAITALNDVLPSEGYALVTNKWPLEFNQPSTVTATNHTWEYSGYINYSRGLTRYQTTDISRKLSYDFQAYTLWSGRISVSGVNEKGESVLFGPQRQALTGSLIGQGTSPVNTANQQIYEEQPFVEFPSQVLVYSTDDISPEFNGSRNFFNLTKSSLAIPASQLTAQSMFVVLGAVVQIPGVDYTVVGNQIFFTSPPPQGLHSNIRVFTSVDQEQTLVTLPLTLNFSETVSFDGSQSSFTASYYQNGNRVDLSSYDINSQNTFLILGGVEQIPFSGFNSAYDSWAYSASKSNTDPTEINITFNTIGGAPLPGTTVDIRAICTAFYWSSRGVYPVGVYSLDSISAQFDGAKTIFDLRHNGKTVNAASVTQDNLIVSLGGAIQIPGVSYTVSNSQIIFLDKVDAPKLGTSINLRIISNAEFINCPPQGKYGGNFVEWGPSLVISLKEQISQVQAELNNLP
jgi:hypothetical protein